MIGLTVESSSLILGRWPNSYFAVELPEDLYQWPMHVLGQPGTGKSTLLANLALRLHALGEGVLVLDVYDGDLAHNVAARADPAQLVYVSPGECVFDGQRHHWGLNPLEVYPKTDDNFELAVSNFLAMFDRMGKVEYSIMTQVRYYLEISVRLSLYLPQPTLLDVLRILMEDDYRSQALQNPNVPDTLRSLWRRFEEATAYFRTNAVNSSIPRLTDMLLPKRLFHTLTQYHSTLKLAQWLDEGKLVVCNFAAGGMSEENARLLGNIVLALFTNAVFRRPVDPPRVWRLVADEFDKLAGNNFADIIDKARKRRVFPIMAHQHLDQLKEDRGDDKKLFNSARNVPIRLNFRLSEEDIATMRWTRGVEFDEELRTLRDFTAKLTLMRGIPGLLDSGQARTIRLDPLEEVDKDTLDERLQTAIASQQAHTTPERALRRRGTMEGEHVNQAATKTRKNPLSTSGQSIPLGDDPAGASGAELPDDFPSLDQLAGLQAHIPQPTKPRRRTPKRGGRPTRNQPGVPEAPQGRGVRGGQTHPQAGQSAGQVGAQLPDQARARGSEKPSGGPRPGDAPLPKPKQSDLPDD